MQGRKAEPIAACPALSMAFDEGLNMPAVKPMVGLKFGMLTPISQAGFRKMKAMWLCLCDCGKYATVSGSDLRSGNTKSCGCYRKIQMAEVGMKNTTHNMTDHPAFKAYCNAKDRCKDGKYKDYGGRGVKFSFLSFDHFWGEIGSLWKPGYSLDRINNDGDYEPGNVRWATRIVQQNNRRANRMAVLDGVEDTVANWCRKLDLNYETIRCRLNSGAPAHEAFSAPCSKFKGT